MERKWKDIKRTGEPVSVPSSPSPSSISSCLRLCHPARDALEVVLTRDRDVVEEVLHDDDIDLLLSPATDNLDGVDAQDLREKGGRSFGLHEVLEQLGSDVEEGVEFRRAEFGDLRAGKISEREEKRAEMGSEWYAQAP